MEDSNEDSISIRRISPANVSFLSDLAPDVFDGSISDPSVAKFVRVSDHARFVAVAEKRVVGQARGILYHKPDSPTELYVDNLGVSAAYQRRGIATKLLRHLCDWGREQGSKSMWVATEIANEQGIGF